MTREIEIWTEEPVGIYAILKEGGDRKKVAWIDQATINGICRITVQGRDLEDGLAPIQIIASIIEEALFDGPPDDEFKMPDPPPWLDTSDWQDGPSQAEFNRAQGITPIEMALANLVIFGGEGQAAHVQG